MCVHLGNTNHTTCNVWKASQVAEGMLCVGCTAKSLDDFIIVYNHSKDNVYQNV